MSKEALSQLFIAACKRAGLKTLYQVSKATGVSTSTLDQIAKGTGSPTIETLEKIFDAIGWDVVITFQPRRRKAATKG